MNKISLISIMFLGLSVVACKQELPEGKIPAQYLEKAKEYEGQYTGDVKLIRRQVITRRGTAFQTLKEISKISDANLSISLDGDRPNIQGDFDFTLNNKCQSSVGNIESVNNPTVINYVANFKFNRGECQNQFMNDKITFWIEKNSANKKMSFEIVKNKKTIPQGYIEEVVRGHFKKN